MILAEYVETLGTCELLTLLFSERDCYCLEVPKIFHQFVCRELPKFVDKLHIVWV